MTCAKLWTNRLPFARSTWCASPEATAEITSAGNSRSPAKSSAPAGMTKGGLGSTLGIGPRHAASSLSHVTPEAAQIVVVYHPGGLHPGVDDDWAYEFEASLF